MQFVGVSSEAVRSVTKRESSQRPVGLTWNQRFARVDGHESISHQTMTIAVGTAIAGRPPHRSVRAGLLHTALTVDDDVLKTARWDKGAGFSGSVANVCLAVRTCPK